MRAGFRFLSLAAFTLAAQLPGCSSEEDPPIRSTGAGGSSSSSGSGGTSGGSGFTPGPCVATNPICYGNREPSTVESGTECMAALDNSPGGTLGNRVQWRQTWRRVPFHGASGDLFHDLNRSVATIKEEACFAGFARGGWMQIFDWDRSSVDLSLHTVTAGFANYVARGSPAPPSLGELATTGLCFVEWDYTSESILPQPVALARWQGLHQPPLPQPWHVAPVVSKRVLEDFDVNGLRGTVPPAEGRIYIDEQRGTVHGYIPFTYHTVLYGPADAIAVPIRELEIRTHFNDDRFNCAGRFRSEQLPATSCDSITPPQWGCADDANCPPDSATMPRLPGGGVGPSYMTGYHLIVDLERVWSSVLQSTLCVSFHPPTGQGWIGDWGRNCRGSPNWNPDLENDAGLPMGDWCSRTNGPADANCHDAYVSREYSADQAFKVRTATPPLTAQDRWTGTCNVAQP